MGVCGGGGGGGGGGGVKGRGSLKPLNPTMDPPMKKS